MSEVQHRHPPRGRGSARGGRGGFAGRGGIRGSRVNGDSNTSSFEDQGEVGQLKRQYAEPLKTVKEMFPAWSDEDIVFALDEEQGDVEATVTRMSEGSISQWGEVKKKKQDRSRSKVPETPTEITVTAGRGRGRGSDIPRGGRGGRATDRGGRPGRGRGGAVATNGQRAPANDDWGKKDGTDDSTGEDSPAAASKSDAKAPAVNNVPVPVKPTWAALLRPPAPPPAPKKVSPPPAPPKPPVAEPTPPPPEPEEPVEPESAPAPAESLPPPPPPPPPTEPALPELEETPKPAEPEPEPEPETILPETVEPLAEPEEPGEPEIPEIKADEPPVESAPQPLTEQNLEKVEDVAPAAPTGTQASTVNSSVAATRSSEVPAPATPRARHVGLSTPKIGSARTASFTRRTLEQQEAVIMPGNHAIDRTTVQFGSLGLNGAAIDDDDYEPEPAPQKPETVAQPPQSPPAEPVTTLPPAIPQAQAPPPPQTQPTQAQVQTPVQTHVQQPIQPPAQQQVQPQISSQLQPQPTHQETLPTPRQAPGLPAQPQVQAHVQHQQQPSPQPPLGPQSMTSQHMNPQISSQFNRFGGIEQTQVAQKPYDSFQQHMPQQHTPQTQAAQLPQSQQAQQQTYGYPTHHQQQQHHQQSHPAQAGLGGLSSLPDQYNYYNSDIQRAGAPGFNYYTNPYGQPTQDTVASLPRAASGMGSAAGETPSQLPTAPSQSASRFGQVGEQTSAHGTPSPGIPTLQPTSQAPNPQQTAAHQQYPMQPYYHPGYYYMNQQFYPTYQTPFAKQQGLYTQPHQNFQYSDHTSTPAGLGSFGGPTTQGRDSGSGVSDYGRGAVSQAQQSHPQHSSANFGGGLPNFLNSRGLPEQQQLGSGVGQQQVAQQGQSDDNLKPFGDSKPPTGPASNAGLQGQPRPGSATSGAANLPQQGSQPQGGMGYPHNLNHHLHGHQAHQQSQHSVAQGQGYGQYSMYGQYPSQYQATNSRQGASGWGGQYGGH